MLYFDNFYFILSPTPKQTKVFFYSPFLKTKIFLQGSPSLAL